MKKTKKKDQFRHANDEIGETFDGFKKIILE